jgi:hypothetical protein
LAESGTIRFHSISPLRSSRPIAADLRQLNDDRAKPVILCRIAHIPCGFFDPAAEKFDVFRLRTEQFRPAIAFRLSDHDGRDEHFFSLFQIL